MAQDLLSINQGNSWAPEGDRSRQIPRYLIIGSYEFTANDLAGQAAFEAAFKAAALKGKDEQGKMIVLPIIANVENTTEGNQEGTFNQGFKEVLREGFPSFNYTVQISNYHAQVLRKLNGLDVRVMVQDSAGAVWGELTSTPGMRGEGAKIFVGGDNFSDGQSSKGVLINVSYTDVEAFKGGSRYFVPGFLMNKYGRLKDVELYKKVVSAGNIHNIGGRLGTGRANYFLDIYPDYSTAMANTARWVATNNQTGAAFTITSVVVNAGGYWVVTLDTTSWSALASGDSVSLRWAYPSVLDPAGVTGVESQVISLVKP
jgi:hypothetical protein